MSLRQCLSVSCFLTQAWPALVSVEINRQINELVSLAGQQPFGRIRLFKAVQS